MLRSEPLPIRRLKTSNVEGTDQLRSALTVIERDSTNIFEVVGTAAFSDGYLLGEGGKWVERGRATPASSSVDALLIREQKVKSEILAKAITVEIRLAVIKFKERVLYAHPVLEVPRPHTSTYPTLESPLPPKSGSFTASVAESNRDDIKITSSEHSTSQLGTNPDNSAVANGAVKALAIEDCPLEHGDVSTLAAAIQTKSTSTGSVQKHCTLRSIYLANNLLGSDGGGKIGNALRSLDDLLLVSISLNQIMSAGAKAVLNGCCNSSSLTILALGNNSISDAGLEDFFQISQSNGNLQELYLNNNVISDTGAHYIAEGLPNLTSLRVLDLSANRVQDQGAKAISVAIKDLPSARDEKYNPVASCSLTVLNLSSNRLRDIAATNIANMLFANRSITHMELANNRISDTGAMALSRALKRRAQFDALGLKISLNCNCIGFGGMQALASFVENAAVRKYSVGLEGNYTSSLTARPHFSQWTNEILSLDRAVSARSEFSRPYAESCRSEISDLSSKIGVGSTTDYVSPASMSIGKNLMAGIRPSLVLNLNEDPEFISTCQRLGIPVRDSDRDRLVALDEQQKRNRAKIYQSYVKVQILHPRPTAVASTIIQSQVRNWKSKSQFVVQKQLVRNKKRLMDLSDIVDMEEHLEQEARRKLAEDTWSPLLNRYFSSWCRVMLQLTKVKTVMASRFSSLCAGMQTPASGVMALNALMHSAKCDALNLEGLGLNSLSTRALCFILRGLSECQHCNGVGRVFGIGRGSSDISCSVSTPQSPSDLFKQDTTPLLAITPRGGLMPSIFRGKNIESDASVRLRNLEARLSLIPEFNPLSVCPAHTLFTAKSDVSRCSLCAGQGYLSKNRDATPGQSNPNPGLLEAKAWLRHLPLTQLILSGNNIGISGLQHIVAAICDVGKEISIVKLAGCRLDQDCARWLALLFQKAAGTLRECDFHDNPFGDQGVSQMAAAAAAHSNALKCWNLSNTKCRDDSAISLGNMLAESQSLCELDVSWNKFSSEAFLMFFSGLGRSTSILRLYIHWNGGGTLDCAHALGKVISSHRSLAFVDCSNNGFDKKEMEVLQQSARDSPCSCQIVLESGSQQFLHKATVGDASASTRAESGDSSSRELDLTQGVVKRLRLGRLKPAVTAVARPPAEDYEEIEESEEFG